VATDRVLNDCLFSNECPASTTRYVLRRGTRQEEHYSSGVWISTAAGSTAATQAAGGRILRCARACCSSSCASPTPRAAAPALPARARLRAARDALEITNAWQPSVVYVDGPHVAIPVAPAATVRFSLSRQPLRLLGYEAAVRATAG